MGAVSSQSQELKMMSSNVDNHKDSDTNFKLGDCSEMKDPKTHSRILVSINRDNTVRISEGKSIATQTPRKGYKLHEDSNTKKKRDVKESNALTNEKRDRSVQTDDMTSEERRIISYNCEDNRNPTIGDNKVVIPPSDCDGNESGKFVENIDSNGEKQDSYRRVNVPESNDASETDSWTDIGVQTGDDLENEILGRSIAWGSKSVDSAKTLNETYFKEANNQEEEKIDMNNDFETPIPARPFEKISLDKYGKYKVRLESDNERCIISSATFLETGDAVVIDRSNQKIKFVDKNFQFISSYDLPAKPWAVCAKGVDVYVTMGNTNIQHLIVEDMLLEPMGFFEIKGRCLGVCIIGEHIAVGLQVGEICLLDFKGKKQGTIQLPSVNSRSCNPWHLTVTAEDNILVTDSDAGAVYCINRKSELIFTFQGISLPRGSCIDTEGNILVVGRDKETGTVVSILHKDVELQSMLHIDQQSEIRSRILMTWEQLEFVPYCICNRLDRIVIFGGIQEALKIMKIG